MQQWTLSKYKKALLVLSVIWTCTMFSVLAIAHVSKPFTICVKQLALHWFTLNWGLWSTNKTGNCLVPGIWTLAITSTRLTSAIIPSKREALTILKIWILLLRLLIDLFIVLLLGVLRYVNCTLTDYCAKYLNMFWSRLLALVKH